MKYSITQAELDVDKKLLLEQMWKIMSPVCDSDIERKLELAIEEAFERIADNAVGHEKL